MYYHVISSYIYYVVFYVNSARYINVYYIYIYMCVCTKIYAYTYLFYPHCTLDLTSWKALNVKQSIHISIEVLKGFDLKLDTSLDILDCVLLWSYAGTSDPWSLLGMVTVSCFKIVLEHVGGWLYFFRNGVIFVHIRRFSILAQKWIQYFVDNICSSLDIRIPWGEVYT